MKENMLKNKKTVVLLCILCTFLWGSAFPVLKMTYSQLQIASGDVASRMLLAGIRFFIASLMLFGLMIIRKQPILKTAKNHLGSLVILGLANTFLQYFFFYNGLANTSGIKASILASTSTFFIIIISPFIYKEERLSVGKILGLLFGFTGILAVNWQKTTAGISADFNILGEGFLIFAGVAATFATLFAKKLSKSMDGVIMNAWQFLVGSIVLMGVGILVGKGMHLHFTPLAILLLIYSAGLSAVAFSIWYSLLRYNTPSSITIFKFLIPVFGSILSSILLPGENFTLTIFIGLICASLGIYLVNGKSMGKVKES